MERLHAGLSASITEFKKNPSALINQAGGEPIALLNHNKPAAYLVPAEAYEQMLELMEDLELIKLVNQSRSDKDNIVSVDIDEL